MANSAQVAERRLKVSDLWLRSVPVSRISTMLKVPHRTIRQDIDVIRQQLAAERLAEVEQARDRSVAALRTIQREAWTVLSRISDMSTSKVGLLNTILNAEQVIARLEGTLGPNVSINQQTMNVHMVSTEEWQRIQQTIDTALRPYPQAAIDVAAALADMDGTSV